MTYSDTSELRRYEEVCPRPSSYFRLAARGLGRVACEEKTCDERGEIYHVGGPHEKEDHSFMTMSDTKVQQRRKIAAQRHSTAIVSD
jgi:hypothetical protein